MKHQLRGWALVWSTTLIVTACMLVAPPLQAQSLPAISADAAATAVAPDDPPSGGGMATRFIRDVGSDYKNFFSVETALWLGAGGGAALAVHPADQDIADAAQRAGNTMPGGSVYGSQYFQLPVAMAWWAIGSAAGSDRNAETGRDLLRAQISVASWTYAIKLATNRTRPNGDSHSFPSGHASASFATAMVLEDHFGWKAGLPAFILASYTAASRVVENDHWTSDVVFGAALGVACARTVTIKFRESRVSIAPVAVPKGGAVMVSVVRPED
jgi:membrane-associated phospholipid phosphatase